MALFSLLTLFPPIVYSIISSKSSNSSNSDNNTNTNANTNNSNAANNSNSSSNNNTSTLKGWVFGQDGKWYFYKADGTKAVGWYKDGATWYYLNANGDMKTGWLYDNGGNVYFQIRKDEGKFYTTASGHVIAGEDVKEAFGREIKEEIGIDLNYNNADLVDVVKFRMDKVKSDGSVFRDRAFANVFAYEFDNNITDLHFDENEVAGLVKVNAKDALRLMKNEKGTINAEIIKSENGNIVTKEKEVDFNDFLVNINEILKF